MEERFWRKVFPQTKVLEKIEVMNEVDQEYVLSVEMGLKILSREAGNFRSKMNIKKSKPVKRSHRNRSTHQRPTHRKRQSNRSHGWQ